MDRDRGKGHTDIGLSAIGPEVLGERGIRGAEELDCGRRVVVLAWDGDRDGDGRGSQGGEDGELHCDRIDWSAFLGRLDCCLVAFCCLMR